MQKSCINCMSELSGKIGECDVCHIVEMSELPEMSAPAPTLRKPFIYKGFSGFAKTLYL